ncbi:MAG: hypothetical protein ACU843_18610 [Gammaproteobacteria bacterium]
MKIEAFSVRLKTFLVLLLFSAVGIGPIPVTSTLGLFIVLFRPHWFKKLVDRIYAV